MQRQELYAALVEHVPPIIAQEYQHPVEMGGTCIPASYHVKEALRKRGVPAKLAVMDVFAGNWQWWSWLCRELEGEMPPDAWSVGAAFSCPDPKPGFNGHVVVISKAHIIDCAIGAFSRPRKNMPLPGGLVTKDALWSNGEAFVLYKPSPQEVPPMWTLDSRATANTTKRVNKALQEHQTTREGT